MCKYASFQFSVTPFDLVNALAISQCMATKLYGDLYFFKIYIDEYLCSKTMIHHILIIMVACECIRWARLKLKLKKLAFAATKFKCFVQNVSAKMVATAGHER